MPAGALVVPFVELGVPVRLPTPYGEFAMCSFIVPHAQGRDAEHIAVVSGDVAGRSDVLVRVHSECLTGDVFGSFRCDCGEQLHTALRRIAAEGGVVLYLRQEGRGIGLANKLRAYYLQEQGADTVQANHELGFPADLRDYGCAAGFLGQAGVQSVRLMTNNPAKVEALQRYGIRVTERVPIEVPARADNRRYLETKRDALNHLLLLDKTG